MTNISHYLVTDSERFHVEYPPTATLAEMAGTNRRCRIIAHVANHKEYRVDGTTYTFTVTTIYK